MAEDNRNTVQLYRDGSESFYNQIKDMTVLIVG